MLELLKTKDNSYTLYNSELNETYHSKNGALQESLYVFIEKGLLHLTKTDNIKIMEVGFGTGLNAILTFKQTSSRIQYTSLEPFPIPIEIIKQLEYKELMNLSDIEYNFFLNMHTIVGGNSIKHENFNFCLVNDKLLSFDPTEKFDLIYFDAFAPGKQDEMWTAQSLQQCYNLMNSGATFVTYCAKGEVKRTLKAIGFKVETLPGPPGKREMIRATR